MRVWENESELDSENEWVKESVRENESEREWEWVRERELVRTIAESRLTRGGGKTMAIKKLLIFRQFAKTFKKFQ